MADILEGNSLHVGSAPFSANQTVSIAKSLQDEMKALGARMDGIAQELERVDCSRLSKMVEARGAKLDEVEDKLATMDTAVDGIKKDVKRHGAALLKLQTGQTDLSEQLHGSQDTVKIVDGRLETLRAELAPTVAQAQACKDQLDKKVDVAINELQGNLETLREHLCKLAEQAQTTRMEVIEDRSTTRTLQRMVDILRDDVGKVTTHIGVIDTRGQETNANLTGATAALSELDATVQRLSKDMEIVKDEQDDMKSGAGSVSNHLKKVSDLVSNAERDRRSMAQRLEQACADVEAAKGMLDTMRVNFQGVKEGQDNAMKTLRNFRGELESVQATANSVRSGLKETRMLVLPNLNMDEGRGHSKGLTSQRCR